MGEWFRVEVSDQDGLIVAIAPEALAGRDIGDRERATLRRAIRQLKGFLGGEEGTPGVCPECAPLGPCEHAPTASDLL